MSFIRYEPFHFVDRLGLAESFFHGLKARPQSRAIGGHWRPAVDVKEEESRFLILVDLPGVDPRDIDVTTEDGVLSLKGGREHEQGEEKNGYKKIERVRGAFYRQFSLPDGVDEEKIEASGKHGVLEISIPKQEKEQAKKITVNH